MSVSRFKVAGNIDGADGATVLVDRERGLISVRPRGRHRTYDLLLTDVAVMIVKKVVVAELAETARTVS